MGMQYTVQCCICHSFAEYTAQSVTKVQKAVNASGWRFVPGIGWLCPRCELNERISGDTAYEITVQSDTV